MKILFIPLFLISIWSCSGEKKSTEGILNYKIDTVIVDPGDEIINLKRGLQTSAIQDSKRHLFLWDMDEGVVNMIDLDELVLAEKIHYEKEGPNGVGNRTSWIGLLEDEIILFYNSQIMSLFDFEGRVIRRYFEKMEEFDGDDVRDLENIKGKPVITGNEDTVYKLSGNYEDRTIKLIKLDYKNKIAKIYDMPGLDELPHFTTLYMSDKSMNVTTSKEKITKYGNRIIFSSNAFSDLYILDIVKDSLYRVSYTPRLTEVSKKGGYPQEVGSKSEFDQLYKNINEEVSFMAPIWDKDNNLFYRFSYETFEYDNLLEDGPKTWSDVYLTIFDDKFNILRESFLEELKNPPASPFVKNGDIWTYVNVNDELGFAIFKLDFNTN